MVYACTYTCYKQGVHVCTCTWYKDTHARVSHAHLQNEVWQECVSLVVAHPVRTVGKQHGKEGLEELEALEVDGRVGVKEAQSDPAEEEVGATDGGVLVGGVA